MGSIGDCFPAKTIGDGTQSGAEVGAVIFWHCQFVSFSLCLGGCQCLAATMHRWFGCSIYRVSLVTSKLLLLGSGEAEACLWGTKNRQGLLMMFLVGLFERCMLQSCGNSDLMYLAQGRCVGSASSRIK